MTIGAGLASGRNGLEMCGQHPSDAPPFAGFLVRAGIIDSISVAPDSFIRVKQHVPEAERFG